MNWREPLAVNSWLTMQAVDQDAAGTYRFVASYNGDVNY